MQSGESVRKNITSKDVNKKQLEMGIKVEKEHTTKKNISKPIARKISLDHLTEIPNYYTRLYKMEQEAKMDKKAMMEPFRIALNAYKKWRDSKIKAKKNKFIRIQEKIRNNLNFIMKQGENKKNSIVSVDRDYINNQSENIVKVAVKYSKEQLDEFAKSTKRWETRNKPIFKEAPLHQRFAPMAGAAAGTVAGWGGAYAIGKAMKGRRPIIGGVLGALSGLTGFIGGAKAGLSSIKNTEYKRKLDKSHNKYIEEVKAIEKM